MIIDSHQHVCWHYKNAADLIDDMDANHVDLAWLLTWEFPPAEDFFEYKVRAARARHDLASSSGEAAAALELVQTIQKVPDPIHVLRRHLMSVVSPRLRTAIGRC